MAKQMSKKAKKMAKKKAKRMAKKKSDKDKKILALAEEEISWAEICKSSKKRKRAHEEQENIFWSGKKGCNSNKATQTRLMEEKTREMGLVLSELNAAKKRVEELTVSLYLHIGYYKDREETRAILKEKKEKRTEDSILESIERKTAETYQELEETKAHAKELEVKYQNLSMEKESLKKGPRRLKNERKR